MAFVRGVDIPGIPIGNIAPILICPKSSLIITRFVLVGGLPRRRFPVAGDCVCLCVCVVFRAFCAFVFVVCVVVGATFVAFTVSMITGVVFVITTTVRDAVARARDSIARLTCLSLQRPDADRWTTIRTFPGAARVAAKPDGRMQTSTTMLVTTHSRASSSSRASSCAVRPNTDPAAARVEKNKRNSERVNQERFRNDSIRVVRARHTAKWVHVGVDAARTDVKVEGEASDRARRGGQNEEGRRESTR